MGGQSRSSQKNCDDLDSRDDEDTRAIKSGKPRKIINIQIGLGGDGKPHQTKNAWKRGTLVKEDATKFDADRKTEVSKGRNNINLFILDDYFSL